MRWAYLTLALTMACAPLVAADAKSKTAERLDDSASLFSEIMGTPDRSIPQDLLEKAHCIVLVPDLKKAAFGVGGKYGRGFALCRAAGGTGWGPPAAIRIEGGSFGLQIGVSSSDVVMLVMNERGMQKLSSSKFTIGADANAAAGPVGRNASAQTDAFMHAEKRRVADYIKQAGGPTRSADKGRIYIIQADGSVLPKQALGSSLEKKKLNPGDSVVVSGVLFIRPNAKVTVKKVRKISELK